MSDQGTLALPDTQTPEQLTAAVEPMTPFTWLGSPWDLAGACLFNAVMTIATLGIYNFWGRTEMRRRMWACVRLQGEPLVYHGTGMELFKGFIGAMLIVLLPLFLLSVAIVVTYGQASAGWSMYQVALLLVVYPVLRSIATYRARRYRLARTSWRGIRSSMSGSSGEFAFLTWAVCLTVPLTLAWVEPWRALYTQRFLIDETMLGDHKLRMTGTAAKLYWRFALLWLGAFAILTALLLAIGTILGPASRHFKTASDWAQITQSQWVEVGACLAAALVIWSLLGAFYSAALYNLTASTTTFLPPEGNAASASLRFKLNTRADQLIWLYLTNMAITYASFYLLKPIASARTLQYFVRHLALVGPFDPTYIRRNPNVVVTDGEGLAQAFDFDAF